MSTRDLRELAESATPGPWRAVEGDLEGKSAADYSATLLGNRESDGTTTGRLFLTLAPNPIDPELGAEVVPALTGDGPQSEANAEFIAAANPQRVLALLDDLADLEAKARALLDAMTRFGPDDSGQLWDAAQALRALVGDETPGTGEGA